MAIASFLVQPREGAQSDVKQALSRLPGATVLPWDRPTCLVVILECPAAELEYTERTFKQTPGVVSVAVAYCNIEDEMDAATGA